MTDTPSAKYGMARPADTDFINTYPATARAMTDFVDTNMSTFITTLPRPAAALAGRFHLDTGTGVISLDTGTGWVEIARSAVIAEVPLGTQVSYTGASLPTDGRWDWANGALISQASFPEYFALIGHTYNGGVDPGGGSFRKPDKRGRVAVGTDSMPVGGAAGRLPNSNRARGQSGGEERHLLTEAEAALPAHFHNMDTAAAGGGDKNTVTIGGRSYVRGDDVAGGTATNAITRGTPGGYMYGIGVGSAISRAAGPATASHNVLQPYEVDNVIVRVK